MFKRHSLILIITLLLPTALFAQSDGVGDFSGTVFADYYWVVNHHNEDIEGANGFRFRRIYFTHEYDLGSSFSTRLRLEMENSGNYLSSSGMTPGVKDAYLKYKPGRHAFYLGISGSPTWGVVEDVWGYRSIEKSPLDLQGYGSSRDFGIAAKGPITGDGTFTYHAMIGNGAGTSSEANKGKKAMLSVGYHPNEQLVFEVYGDYNDRPGTSRTTLQAFVGYKTQTLNLGGLFAHQFRENFNDQTILSAFTHFQASNRVKGIFRIDHTFEPNLVGPGSNYMPFSSLAESTLLLAGVDYQPVEDVNVHFMPNVETVFYSDAPSSVDTPDTDLVAKFTVSYGF